MTGEAICYRPIGTIRTPFQSLAGMPIQPSSSDGARGRLELLPHYAEGLLDLDGFSHIILIYHLHASRGFELRVTPFLDTERRGVFATRAPRRPNSIGMSVVRLLSIEGAVVQVEDVDVLDGTPLLDIKPYVPDFESTTDVRLGWLEKTPRGSRRSRADDRFLVSDDVEQTDLS